MIEIKSNGCTVPIASLSLLTDFPPGMDIYSPAGLRYAYALSARRVLEAITNQRGARAEAAYMGTGDAAFEGDNGRGIGEEL